MTRCSGLSPWVVALGIGLSVVLIGSCLAGLLEDREDSMRSISRAFRPLGEMAKKKRFDAATVAANGKAIAEELKHFTTLFPAGSEQADHGAAPEIWSDRADFEKAATDAIAAAGVLAQAGDATAFQNAVGGMDHACRACHRKYKIDH